MLVISVDKQCSANLLPVFSESSCLQTAAPIDLGGGDWLEPVTGALEFDIFGPGMGWDGMGWDGQALAEGGVGRGLWSLIFGPVIPGLW